MAPTGAIRTMSQTINMSQTIKGTGGDNARLEPWPCAWFRFDLGYAIIFTRHPPW
jgi:hypothetical protein